MSETFDLWNWFDEVHRDDGRHRRAECEIEVRTPDRTADRLLAAAHRLPAGQAQGSRPQRQGGRHRHRGDRDRLRGHAPGAAREVSRVPEAATLAKAKLVQIELGDGDAASRETNADATVDGPVQPRDAQGHLLEHDGRRRPVGGRRDPVREQELDQAQRRAVVRRLGAEPTGRCAPDH